MSRSNGNSGYGGQAPQQGHPAPQHPQHPQQAVPQWRHPLDVDDGTHAQQQAWPASQHGAPYAGQHAPQQQPFYAQQPPQHGYAPYQPQPEAPPDYGHQAPHYADPHQGHGSLAAYHPQAAQQPELAPYAPPGQWPQQAAPDPRGFDLGDYAAGSAQQQAQQRYSEQAFAHDPQTRPLRTQPPAGWPQPGQQTTQQHAPAAGFGSAFGELAQQRSPAHPQGYAPPSPFVANPAGAGSLAPHAGLAADHGTEEYADEEEFEEDEPRRSARTIWVVSALVGAICLGGGLAYTYKIVSGGNRSAATKSDVPPVKTSRPATPSGQSGPKVGEKLPEVAPKAQVASEGETGGPRRVAIIPVGPDSGSQPAAPQAPQTVTPFPGMVVAQPPAPSAVAPPARVPQQQAAAPVQPKIVTPAPAPAPKVAAVTDPPAQQKKVVTKQKQDDAFSPATPGSGGVASAVTPAPRASGLGAGGNGFVAAILSTQKGRAEAMKAFADLQQKYGEVLAAKPAEVQEVNLGEGKGVWYRAVVGPPGSREGASQICAQLLAAGHKGCFATAY